MQKRILLNGRIAIKCTCDKCNRVIYVHYPIKAVHENNLSYYDAKKVYEKLNPLRVNEYNVWVEADFYGTYCEDCIDEKSIESELVVGDVLDSIRKCCYTEIRSKKT